MLHAPKPQKRFYNLRVSTIFARTKQTRNLIFFNRVSSNGLLHEYIGHLFDPDAPPDPEVEYGLSGLQGNLVSIFEPRMTYNEFHDSRRALYLEAIYGALGENIVFPKPGSVRVYDYIDASHRIPDEISKRLKSSAPAFANDDVCVNVSTVNDIRRHLHGSSSIVDLHLRSVNSHLQRML